MSAEQQEEELSQQMDAASVSEQPSEGPKRASRSKRMERPPTAFALAPINPISAPKPSVSEPAQGFDDSTEDDQPTNESEEDQTTETPEEEPESPTEEEESASSSGPTRAKKTSIFRPPTTFVAAPITGGAAGLPGSPFPGRGPADSGPQRAAGGISRPGTTFVRGGVPRGGPGGPGRGGRAPSPGGSPAGSPGPRDQLIEQEKADAKKCASLKVNTNDLLQYSTAEEIFSRSSVYSTLSSKVDNLHVMEQLFVCLSNPKQCTLFNSISSGLGEQRVQELHNKMKCVAIQLITQVHNPKVTGMIFRHNLLDRFYVELLTSPAPLNELSTHYLREVLNHLLKNHKETVLDYLASPVPGKNAGTRAQLMLPHFYAENITYLFDELLTAEETHAQQQQANGGPAARGGRGAPPRGGAPGSPARGRGGPRGGPGGPRGGRGGPGGARGRGGPPARGGPRGGPPGRGGPARGRGGAGAPPARSGPNFRFSRTFDLHKELKKQFFGGAESGSDKMIAVRSQSRVVNTAHIYQGLLFRGWDMPTITAILKDIGSYADQMVDSQWRGVEVAEYQIKVLVAVLKFMNKHWNPSTPRGQTIADSADTLIRDRLCKGSFRKALDSHPGSTLPTLKIVANGSSCTLGGLRLQILYFASFIPLVRFLDRYVQEYIESGIIKRAIDLFFEYSHHFFLHETVARSLLTNVIKCKDDRLVTHVFVDCKLLERIMDNFQPFSKSRSKEPSSYVSYSGHLLYLANLIRDLKVLNRAGLSSKLSCVSRWETFLSSEVRTENQL